ncbi:MAG: CHAT domain-containing protein [Holophagales bacterium]|nr:CHAT domain-containing protein [Holophagales bacterium]
MSDEPWIPWEILRPFELEGDDFLCMRFQMSRWLAGETPLVMKKRIGRMVGLEADEHGGLPNARREIRFLEHLVERTPGLEGVFPPRATTRMVAELFEKASFDLFHFVGHGEYDEERPGEARILLEDRAFRARHLPAAAQTKLRSERPAIFFNACQVGRSSRSLADLDGWAPRWVSRFGCSAFLAPFWTVKDERAFRFAQVFYKGLEEGRTLGHAVLRARHELRDENPHDMAWLAYSLYGHPAATILFGDDRSGRGGLEGVSVEPSIAIEPPLSRRVSEPEEAVSALRPAEDSETVRRDVRTARDPSGPRVRSRPPTRLPAAARRSLAVAAVLVLPIALGALGQMTHGARETLLRLSPPLSYPVATLLWTGTEAVGSLLVNALTAPFSSRPEIRISAWLSIVLTLGCWGAIRSQRRRPLAGHLAVCVAMALTASILWVGIHLYTFALRARHPGESPQDSTALCSNYFPRDPGKPGKPATITEQIVVESCSWLDHPTETHGEWRQSLSGLVVFLLLSSVVALRGGLGMGRQRGWLEAARRILIGANAVVLLLTVRQLPLAHAYYQWGLQYPSVTQVGAPHSELSRAIAGGSCCVYDVSEGANETVLFLWGPGCPVTGEQRWQVDGPSSIRQARRIVTGECGSSSP